jgi:hypothetical protein
MAKSKSSRKRATSSTKAPLLKLPMLALPVRRTASAARWLPSIAAAGPGPGYCEALCWRLPEPIRRACLEWCARTSPIN